MLANCSLPRLVGGGTAVLLVLLAIAAPSRALADGEKSLRDLMRFTYWTECSPLRLIVLIGDPEEAARIGLTEEAITTAVRSRLRAARLYTDTSNPEVPRLVILVRVVNSKIVTGGAFNIDMALNKPRYDPLSGHSFPAGPGSLLRLLTNSHSTDLGLHSGDSTGLAFILSAIGQKMDGFLDAYLRVNESACD